MVHDMTNWLVTGGKRLSGEIAVHGAKNAALPILAATVLIPEPVELKNCPPLSDVEDMCEILRTLGASVRRSGDTVTVDTASATHGTLPDALSHRVRSSIFLLGSLVARFSKACAPYPGGCEIGNRPIDLHLYALSRLGVSFSEGDGRICASVDRLTGAVIDLDYPSVGATENAILAAVRAEGETVLRGAACEPEITDLANFLNACGFCVHGAGTPTIVISGQSGGHGVSYRILPDRIVTGTYLIAAAITRGSVAVTETDPALIGALLSKLEACGCRVETFPDAVRLTATDRPKELVSVETRPYPAFATDLQAQLFALLSIATGTSVITERIFENRFRHAAELKRMGAQNEIIGQTAIIRGVKALHGARVTAFDLRCGAALALAGLAAEGETEILYAERIDRGYDRMDEAIRALGGQIQRKEL